MDKEEDEKRERARVSTVGSAQMKEAKKGRRVGSVLHPNDGLSCGASRERDRTPTQQ